MRQAAIINLRYFPDLLLVPPEDVPANLSDRGATIRGPMVAIRAAMAVIVMASSFDSPRSFICRVRNGKRLPRAENMKIVWNVYNLLFKHLFNIYCDVKKCRNELNKVSGIIFCVVHNLEKQNPLFYCNFICTITVIVVSLYYYIFNLRHFKLLLFYEDEVLLKIPNIWESHKSFCSFSSFTIEYLWCLYTSRTLRYSFYCPSFLYAGLMYFLT